MTRPATFFEKRFGLGGPLVVAPLGAGPTTPELVIASCEAGALGSLAAAYLPPSQIDEAVERIKARTKRPFAINLFTPMPEPALSPSRIEKAISDTEGFRREVGLPTPKLTPPFHPDFDHQFERVLRAKPAAFSFVFGALDAASVDECRKNGIFTIGTATTRDEALALEERGVDAVVAQGVEAGGHRGMFRSDDPDPGIGTFELSADLSGKLRIPVIAAGGLMNGRDVANALRAGAQAAMLGTAFLLCPEAATSKPYREALRRGGVTRLTRVFSGRIARGLENRFMREISEDSVLPFPAQNAFTRDLRKAFAAAGSPEALSLWAGTGLAGLREDPARDLIQALFDELNAATE